MAAPRSTSWLDRSLVIAPCYIAYCGDEKAFERELKALQVPREEWPEFITAGASATTHEITHHDGRTLVIVTIRPDDKHTLIEQHSLLVHEAVHVWQTIRRSLGEHSPSDEFEAYSIQSISGRLMQAHEEAKRWLKNQRKRKRSACSKR